MKPSRRGFALVAVAVLAVAGLTGSTTYGDAVRADLNRASFASPPSGFAAAHSAVQGAASEELTAPFADLPVATKKTYSGQVTLEVSGQGREVRERHNDALYIFTDEAGNRVTPVVLDGLCVNGTEVRALTPERPVYTAQGDHLYSLVIDLGNNQHTLEFGTCDTFRSDNAGEFEIKVSEAAKPRCPATRALPKVGHAE
jgi:hypothetical protein